MRENYKKNQEHTTLCGSQKYPVRDPFFKMLNRSLATFMNAFTGKQGENTGKLKKKGCINNML